MIAADRRAYTVDRDTHAIRFERHVAATPARVFDAWTIPDEVTHWWDPDGRPLEACEIDLRVGGTFTFVSPGHSEMPFTGVYREIDPPTRIVFEAMGATGRVVLTPAAGGTRMVVDIVCQSREHLERFMQVGVHEGTARTLDNLATYAADVGARS